LSITLGAQNRGLLSTFRLFNRGLTLTVRNVHRRLLLPFGLEDSRSLFLVGLLLQSHCLENLIGWGNFKDFDAIDAHAPFVGRFFHLGLQHRANALALRESFVKRDTAEDRPHGRPGKIIGAHQVVRVRKQREANVHHLAKNCGIHDDRDVVTRNDLLAIARSRGLSNVNNFENFNEGHDETKSRILDVLELAKSGDDTDKTLLNDAYGLRNGVNNEQHHHACDHGKSDSHIQSLQRPSDFQQRTEITRCSECSHLAPLEKAVTAALRSTRRGPAATMAQRTAYPSRLNVGPILRVTQCTADALTSLRVKRQWEKAAKLTSTDNQEVSVDVATFVASIFDGQLPFRVEAFDGSSAAPNVESSANNITLKILNRDALVRFITRPGELGLARAYVAGDIDVEGDLDALFSLQVPPLRQMLTLDTVRGLASEVGTAAFKRLAPPSIEARQRGALHSRSRDKDAISHHYDVSNHFYEMVLGPSMTYSCAAFRSPDDTLEVAQRRKVDLVARKLELQRGMRLLDVGSGWGAMAIHAAKEYGASAVGVTLSGPQQSYATEQAKLAGVSDLVEFRLQDYRDVKDGPFDAISSIGMSEHVGRRSLPAYTQNLFDLLKPGGRFLNHAIGRPVSFEQDPQPTTWSELNRQMQIALGMRGPSKTGSPFIERYVFPDGELHEVGTMVSMFQAHGFEVRHLESLREHYALTLRHWVENLMKRWDEAVDEVGEQRARVWRLYMSGSAVGFERHHLEIHQILSVKPVDGKSGLALRPDFEPTF
jgi:cyclopropane-fatty-acyl-phospholipid synthase